MKQKIQVFLWPKLKNQGFQPNADTLNNRYFETFTGSGKEREGKKRGGESNTF